MPVVSRSSPPDRYGVGSVSSLAWTPVTSRAGGRSGVTGARSSPRVRTRTARVGIGRLRALVRIPAGSEPWSGRDGAATNRPCCELLAAELGRPLEWVYL